MLGGLPQGMFGDQSGEGSVAGTEEEEFSSVVLGSEESVGSPEPLCFCASLVLSLENQKKLKHAHFTCVYSTGTTRIPVYPADHGEADTDTDSCL